MHFKMFCFRMFFGTAFLWISGVSWKLKPWILYGRGSAAKHRHMWWEGVNSAGGVKGPWGG